MTIVYTIHWMPYGDPGKGYQHVGVLGAALWIAIILVGGITLGKWFGRGR